MAEDLCTVEAAADRLQLHPKTVLRYIREGRLSAVRLGKAYRIRKADVDALAGLPPPAPIEAHVTTIVDLPDVWPELARRWATTVTGALGGRPAGPALRADVVYDPDRSHLKIVVIGGPRDVAGLLNLIAVWSEQLGA